MANQLFKELGMDQTYNYRIDKLNNGLVNGYSLEKGKVDFVEFDSIGFNEKSWKDFIPAGGIISNTYDFSIWDTKLHNWKILNSDIIVPKHKYLTGLLIFKKFYLVPYVIGIYYKPEFD